MTCEQAQALLVDELSRSLSAGEKLALLDHTTTCESCAHDAEEGLGTREVIAHLASDAAHVSVRDGFDASVHARVRAAHTTGRRLTQIPRVTRRRWLIPALAAAAAAAVLLIATRPLDDVRDSDPIAQAPTSRPVDDEGALPTLALSDVDAFAWVDDSETTAAGATEDEVEAIAIASIFSEEEIAYLAARVDEGDDDELASEISEMSDDAAHGLEGAIDAARKPKSG